MATQDQSYRAGESKGQTQEKEAARETMGGGRDKTEQAKDKPAQLTKLQLRQLMPSRELWAWEMTSHARR
ncbi:hypothetical protein ACHQM5_007236 [Ranunculus cassubicifolius]